MATRILCANAKFAPKNKNALICKQSGDPCAYQMWCGVVGHATNVSAAYRCQNFEDLEK